MLTDPYRLLSILREQYPCYRDWKGNRFWITRYDDVTSVFADDANFETRPKRCRLGDDSIGRDLWDHIPVLTAHAERIDAALPGIVERAIADLVADDDRADLAVGFAARLPLELWGAVLELPADDLPAFAQRYWRMQRGTGWDMRDRLDGLAAFDELDADIDPLLERRRADPGDDLISAIAHARPRRRAGNRCRRGGHAARSRPRDAARRTGQPVVQPAHAPRPVRRRAVRAAPDEVRLARDAAPQPTGPLRPTRSHDTRSSASAACFPTARCSNSRPRPPTATRGSSTTPTSFVVGRKDLCQREPRGQYRADGLPSGIAFGFGRPSIHPAVPKERPRSIYAITRDVAVTASTMLLDAVPHVRLADGAGRRSAACASARCTPAGTSLSSPDQPLHVGRGSSGSGMTHG